MAGRFKITDRDFPVKVLINKIGEEYINVDDLIKWLKRMNEAMGEPDRELIFTIIKSLIRFKNDKI